LLLYNFACAPHKALYFYELFIICEVHLGRAIVSGNSRGKFINRYLTLLLLVNVLPIMQRGKLHWLTLIYFLSSLHFMQHPAKWVSLARTSFKGNCINRIFHSLESQQESLPPVHPASTCDLHKYNEHFPGSIRLRRFLEHQQFDLVLLSYKRSRLNGIFVTPHEKISWLRSHTILGFR